MGQLKESVAVGYREGQQIEHGKGFYGSAAITGATISIAWIIGAGAMLVSLGAWGWIIWPAVAFISLNQIIKAVTIYKSKTAHLALPKPF